MSKNLAKVPTQFSSATTIIDALNFIGRMIFSGWRGGVVAGAPHTISVDDATAVNIFDTEIPAEASFCLVTVIPDDTTVDKSFVVSFTEDGTTPTASLGMPLGQGGSVEITGGSAMKKAKVIGVEAGRTHSLRVQFYK